MSKLTTKSRKAIPTKDFAGPGRSYPIEDRAHAANAKSRATQQERGGNLSPSAASKIKAAANKKLGKR